MYYVVFEGIKIAETYSTFEEAFLSNEWLRTFGWDYCIIKNDTIIAEFHDYSYWNN